MTSVPPEQPPGPAAAPAAEPGPHQGPRLTSFQLRDVSRLRRTVLGERKIAGVAGGLARHFDIDPLVVRVALVVLALFGGSGVILYGALWLLLPEDGSDSAAIRLDERSLTVALVGVGVIAGLALLGTWSDARWVSWPLAAVALVFLLVATARDRRPPSYRPGSYPPGFYPPGSYPPAPGPEPTTSATTPAAPPPPYAGTGADRSATDAQPGGGGALPSTLPPAPPFPGSTPAARQVAPPGYQTGMLPPAPPRPPAGPTWHQPLAPLRDPRRRGPLLVWFTLALMTLSLGVLGMIDVAGSDIPVSAYPALATGVAGLMLLVGAFFGRAGGIIFLGLVATTAMVGTTIGERIETRYDVVRPTSAADLPDTYSLAAGDTVYDLTAIEDLASLDGRHVTVEQGAGRVEVIVPRGIDVQVGTTIGAGSASVLNADREGVGLDFVERRDVANEPATLTLQIEIGVGEVDVHVEAAPVSGGTVPGGSSSSPSSSSPSLSSRSLSSRTEVSR